MPMCLEVNMQIKTCLSNGDTRSDDMNGIINSIIDLCRQLMSVEERQGILALPFMHCSVFLARCSCCLSIDYASLMSVDWT